MVIDITGCFYHIYTHSIAWAVKGKEVAKENVGKDTFEKIFDGLMQHTNYNETNGIIVGPEVSRIFAEIIMQAIDLAIHNNLKQKGYSLGRDYEIRRYVDDSYVYARTRKILDDILLAYDEHLAFYKMDINKGKLKYYIRPFTAGVSDAKRQVNRLLADFKMDYLKTDDNGHYVKEVKKDMPLLTMFAKHFRSITHQFKVEYGTLNKYTLTLLLRQIRNESIRVPSLNLLTAYVEIAFYIFSLDMHTTASYRLCSILEALVVWADKNPDAHVKQELKNRIRREFKRVIDIYQSDIVYTTNLEVLNLLTTLNRLIGIKIPVSQIEALFGLDVKSGKGYEKLNYFQICTLLYVMENENAYTAVRDGIEKDIMSRLSSPKVLRKAEMTYLLFDLMTCPYVTKDTCNKVLLQCNIVSKIENADKKRAELARPGRWFYDWNKEHPLTDFLRKKEYHSPYE